MLLCEHCAGHCLRQRHPHLQRHPRLRRGSVQIRRRAYEPRPV